MYFWNPVSNLIGLLPLGVILLVFIVLKENRQRQALWILVPFLVLNLIWFLFKAMIGFPSQVISILGFYLGSIITGMLINWLFAERIGNRNRFVTLILSFLLFLGVLGIELFGIGFRTDTLGGLILSVVSYCSILMGFVFSTFGCRKRFTAVRFSVSIFIGILVSLMILFFIVMVVQGLLTNSFSYFIVVIIPVLLSGLAFSLVLYVVVLGYLILVFNNRFWRKRFEAVFKIDSGLSKVDEGDDAEMLGEEAIIE